MKPTLATSVVVLLASLLACASPPSPTLYLLRADEPAPSGRVDSPVRVALRVVSVAAYLDQPGIVVETDPNQVSAAQQHLWSEPLEDGLRALIRAGLSESLGYPVSASRIERFDWDYTVDVAVEQLHATMGGEARIEASYQITPSPARGQAAAYRFSQSLPLPEKGYPGVVEAEARLTRDLASAIATSLRELGAP